MNRKMESYNIEDGCIIEQSILDMFNIPPDCIKKETNEIKSCFVGFVFNNNKVLVSYPKHHPNNNKKLLYKVLKKYRESKAYIANGEKDIASNIPFDSMSYIIHYYYKYGVYSCSEKIVKANSKNKINWKVTYKKSNKVITDNGLIYIPLYMNKSSIYYDIISDIMRYSLASIRKIYKTLGDDVLNENQNYSNSLVNQYGMILKILYDRKNTEYKDYNKKLIKSLIEFFEYIVSSNKLSFIYTCEFQNIWEQSVGEYLNKRFIGIDEENGKFKYGETKNHFTKTTFLVDNSINRHVISIDHFLKNENKIVYVFDSKYYIDVKELDYKQVSYCYFVANKYDVILKNICCALIIPTSKEQYRAIHIDRSEFDGILIYEEYLNILQVLANYISVE